MRDGIDVYAWNFRKEKNCHEDVHYPIRKAMMATEHQIKEGKKFGLNLRDATCRLADLALGKAKRDEVLQKKGIVVGSRVKLWNSGDITGVVMKSPGGWKVKVCWENQNTKKGTRIQYLSPNSIELL